MAILVLTFVSSQQAFADAGVSIPSGSSSPGCESYEQCYLPAQISINVGEEVTWTNDDTAAHTVTSGDINGAGPDGYFDSGLFMAGKSFSYRFEEAGEFPYFCLVHPWMTGMVFVSGSSSYQNVITVYTDASRYSDGDRINIAGEVGNRVSGYPVTLQILSSNGNLITLEQLDVSNDNIFETSIIAGENSLWENSGTYTVKVIYGIDDVTAETTFRYTAKTSSDDSNRPPPMPSSADIMISYGSSSPGCEDNNSCFSPTTKRISSGQTITWYNADSAAHTVTSGDIERDGPDGYFDSGLFMAGKSFSYRFVDGGTYDYFCLVHPWMVGTIIVSEGSTTGNNGNTGKTASLSISTDDVSYASGDMISLTAKTSQKANVAVSVTDSSGNNFLTRTISTDSSGFGQIQFKVSDSAKSGNYQVSASASINGNTVNDSTRFTVDSSSGSITIISVEPTDQQGNPVSTFNKGKLGFAKVVLSSDAPVTTLVTVNLFDSDLTSLGIGSFKTTLNGQSEMILSFSIPNDTVIGSGEIFVNALSDWPSNGGIALTGEASTMVNIR